MSLCPDYCSCPPCKHGTQTCLICDECRKERDQKRRQEQHEDSVRRQRMKIRRIHE